jgi:hypothetical protein
MAPEGAELSIEGGFLMRKKISMLALSLAALAGALTLSPVEAGGTKPCPRCTYYADGSKCCVSCICDATTGFPVACTNNYCPPAGGGTD